MLQGLLNMNLQLAGQSGFPVIRASDHNVTGVHVLGGSIRNSASDIEGRYGNPLDVYIPMPQEQRSPIGQIFKINIIKPLTLASHPAEHSEASFSSEGDTEGFWDVFKSVWKVVVNVGSNALPLAAPLLGPGAPAAAMGGIALGVLGKALESSLDGGHYESELSAGPHQDHIAHRAVLAEAALQVYLSWMPTLLLLRSSSHACRLLIARSNI